MKTTPHLLDELVKLTSIRDAELLEYSLLRTIQDVLAPLELALFRISAGGVACYQMLCDADHGPRVQAEPRVAADVLAAACAASGLRQPNRSQRGDGALRLVYPVVEMRGFTTYLHVVLRDGRGAAGDEGRLIDGFLRFYENYCGLLDYSQRDQLTGLMNRKTFDESVFKLFSQAERQIELESMRDDDRRTRATRGQFWLGMIDIDHFKRINDGFGHLYGDEVLLLAAQIMQRGFRDTDLLFRFGGEEFVVIAQNTDREGARHVFGRLREAIAAHNFPQVGQVTVSIGVVRLVPGNLTPILLDQADKALYWAKQHGRNQVAIFEELLERGEIRMATVTGGGVDLF